MNKRKGIEFLKEFNLNTIDLLSIKDLYNNPGLINEGLSLRLSSYKNGIDVNLPSIHNVTNVEDVLDFYKKFHNKFDVLIHKTIVSKEIGSVSKYQLGDYTIIAIETFKDFIERKEEKVNENALLIIIGNRIIERDYHNFKNKALLREILDNVLDITYDNFDLEFVLEDELIFTDFYSKDYSMGKHLIKRR